MSKNKILLTVGFMLAVNVSGLQMSLVQQGTEVAGTFKVALVVDSASAVRGLNAEISFDTANIIVDSIVGNLPAEFPVYKSSVISYWRCLHFVAAYPGIGSANLTGVVTNIYGRTKSSTGSTIMEFNKTRVGAIDSMNAVINVNYIDCQLSLAHVSAENNGAALAIPYLFTASPNPFSSYVNLNVAGLNNVEVNVFSVDGRKVYGFVGNKGVWNAEAVPNGMYFAVVGSGDLRITRTLILQR
jgi:hypothetical protein